MKNLMPVLPKRWHLHVLIFILLYALYINFDQFNFVNFYTYLFRVKGIFKFTSSLFLYSGLVASAVMLLTSGNRLLKILSYLLLAFTTTIEISYYIINGYGFTYTEASIALRETGFAGDAITAYLPRIWFIPLLALLFAVTLYWVTEKFIPKSSWKLSIPCTLFFFLLSFYVLSATMGQQTYPTMFKVPVLALYAKTNPIFMGPRDPVIVSPVRTSEYRHIIYLVDESVRGDMISLNDPSNNVTPYLLSVSDHIYNYGIVSSGGNNSGNSQLILRSGLKSDFFPDTGQSSLRFPDILQYAKKAGFTTNFLDGQKDVLQNYMKEPEMAYIDNYRGIKEKSMSGNCIDYLLADYIIELIKDTSKRTFTYVVKMGAHFNYEEYYPDNEKIFIPTMKKGELNNDPEKMTNSYKNVIRWNVDLFFKYLIEKLGKRKDYIILYTSDHGQTLLDHGIVSTHADVRDAHPYQACVPFFIYFPDSTVKARFRYNSLNYDRVTHFNLFPSLLLMMGYDTTWVNRHYERNIFEPLDGHSRYFFTGIIFMKGNGAKTLFDTPEMSLMMKNLRRGPHTLSFK